MLYLKKDGQNCCALLLGLRNDYQFHQNFLIANGLKTKPLAIFFLYSLQLQELTAFRGEQETAIGNAEPYQQWHFAPLFRQKSLKRKDASPWNIVAYYQRFTKNAIPRTWCIK